MVAVLFLKAKLPMWSIQDAHRISEAEFDDMRTEAMEKDYPMDSIFVQIRDEHFLNNAKFGVREVDPHYQKLLAFENGEYTYDNFINGWFFKVRVLSRIHAQKVSDRTSISHAVVCSKCTGEALENEFALRQYRKTAAEFLLTNQWFMETSEYSDYIQWLPLELLEDVLPMCHLKLYVKPVPYAPAN